MILVLISVDSRKFMKFIKCVCFFFPPDILNWCLLWFNSSGRNRENTQPNLCEKLFYHHKSLYFICQAVYSPHHSLKREKINYLPSFAVRKHWFCSILVTSIFGCLHCFWNLVKIALSMSNLLLNYIVRIERTQTGLLLFSCRAEGKCCRLHNEPF